MQLLPISITNGKNFTSQEARTCARATLWPGVVTDELTPGCALRHPEPPSFFLPSNLHDISRDLEAVASAAEGRKGPKLVGQTDRQWERDGRREALT